MAGKAPGSQAKEAIITVGAGRGFLIEHPPSWSPLVITAAHCLPDVPPAYGPASGMGQHVYRNLLGPLNEPPTLSAACLFVDPIADLAVLAALDGQDGGLFDEEEAYERFTEHRHALRIGTIARRCPVWVLSLAGRWETCGADISAAGKTVNIIGGNIEGGMSGSPILNKSRRAIGILSLGGESSGKQLEERHGQPALVSNLPVWLVLDFFKPDRLVTSVDAMKRGWERYLRTSAAHARKRLGLGRQRKALEKSTARAGAETR